MNPKVSVIVPNYNHARFLEKRLDSIFNQTFRDFEVILLDDASTDGSVRILEEYAANSNVSHFIKNNKNSGSPFKQWKKGIDLASGEFIWIAESDDFCDPKFLEEIFNKIDWSISLAYCASYNVNSGNEKLGINRWAAGVEPARWIKNYRNNGRSEIDRYLKFRNTIPNASAVVFRKNALKEVQFPIEMKYCGDWYLWLNILKNGDILYIHKPLNYFRKHTTITAMTLDLNQEKQRFREYMKIVKAESSFINRLINRKKYNWIINERCRKEKVFRGSNLTELNFPLDFIIRYYFFC